MWPREVTEPDTTNRVPPQQHRQHSTGGSSARHGRTSGPTRRERGASRPRSAICPWFSAGRRRWLGRRNAVSSTRPPVAPQGEDREEDSEDREAEDDILDGIRFNPVQDLA